MKLSVIISHKDDPIGTSITVAGLIQSLKGIDSEIIVIDNSDKLHKLALDNQYIKDGTVRVLYTNPPSLFAAREEGIKHALGRWILILDSHMLLGYRAIEEMIELAESRNGDLGIVYGNCVYHVQDSKNGFIDRNIDTLKGIRRGDNLKTRQICFRGVPMIMEKSHFMRIGGYGCLAKNYLPWGGGDYLLGIKTLVLGFENWGVPTADGIHLGPFKNGPLKSSYMRVNESNWPDYIGMLCAAYIVGGDNTLRERIQQIKNRIGKKNKDLESKQVWIMAKRLAGTDYEWLRRNRVYSLDKLKRLYRRR